MYSFAHKVTSYVQSEITLPDTVIKRIYDCMVDEEERVLPSVNNSYPPDTPDRFLKAYVLSLLFILRKLPAIQERRTATFTASIGSLLALTNEELYALWKLNEHGLRKYAGSDIRKDKEIGTFDGDFAQRYCKPLWRRLFSLPVSFDIPQDTRTEHTYIMAGSGHGKTQLMQYLIAQDIKKDATVIVIDGKGSLIPNIKMLKAIPPERLVILDPSDVEFPLALNIFDVDQDKLATLSQYDREASVNRVISLLTFVFSSVDTELTGNMKIPFQFLIQLLIHIPNATAHTLLEILGPSGLGDHKKHLPKISRTGQMFFTQEYDSPNFRPTKTYIRAKIYGVLGIPAIDRLFNHKRAGFSMKTLLDSGKVILIYTNLSFFEDKCSFIGRYFLSLIAQASQQRQNETFKKETYLYIDEAQLYFDSTTQKLLSLVREQNVGVTVATQEFKYVPDDVLPAILTNTATKFIGKGNYGDAVIMSKYLNCEPEFIQNQPKGAFATHVKDLTISAIPIKAPHHYMENMDKRSLEQMQTILNDNRKAYSAPPDDSELPPAPTATQPPSPDVHDSLEDLNKA